MVRYLFQETAVVGINRFQYIDRNWHNPAQAGQNFGDKVDSIKQTNTKVFSLLFQTDKKRSISYPASYLYLIRCPTPNSRSESNTEFGQVVECLVCETDLSTGVWLPTSLHMELGVVALDPVRLLHNVFRLQHTRFVVVPHRGFLAPGYYLSLAMSSISSAGRG